MVWNRDDQLANCVLPTFPSSYLQDESCLCQRLTLSSLLYHGQELECYVLYLPCPGGAQCNKGLISWAGQVVLERKLWRFSTGNLGQDEVSGLLLSKAEGRWCRTKTGLSAGRQKPVIANASAFNSRESCGSTEGWGNRKWWLWWRWSLLIGQQTNHWKKQWGVTLNSSTWWSFADTRRENESYVGWYARDALVSNSFRIPSKREIPEETVDTNASMQGRWLHNVNLRDRVESVSDCRARIQYKGI